MSQIGPLLKEPGNLPVRARPLLLIVVVALVHGLLYLAVVPPWQHYDEPTHFEYVRLIVERGRLPLPGDSDPDLQRKIAASMKAAGFWELIDAQPPNLDSEEVPSIGYSELEHPPLYYIALALPQWLLKPNDIDVQLYLARFVSLLLYPVIVVATYGLAAEVFPGRRGLHLAAAGLVALLPSLADLMSSVNNDSGAAAVGSLFLWSSMRLRRRGLSPVRAGVTLVLAAACFTIKCTAGSIAIVVPLILGLTLAPRSWRRWMWGGLTLLAIVIVAAVFTWTERAAYWYGDGLGTTPNRQPISSPVGSWAFVLTRDGHEHPSALSQELQILAGQRLRGHVVTFGTWLKAADTQGGAVAIRLYDGTTWHWHNVQVGSNWQFYCLKATIASEAPTVSASIGFPREGPAQSVYADGMILVDRPVTSCEPPRFDTAQAQSGTWGGESFGNLLRNSSAERAWPALRPWLSRLRLYRTPASQILASILDWSRTAWVYRPDVSNVVLGFWGRFGWGTPALPAGWLSLFGTITVAALAGAVIGLARAPWAWRWQVGTMLGSVLVLGWVSAILRIHPVFVLQKVYWPGARYAFVVIAPTTLVLCAGLARVLPFRWRRWGAYAGSLGMIALDVVALWAVVVPYYYR